MTPELTSLALQVLSVLAAGFGSYAAIKAKLAELESRVINIEKIADQAHRRIDQALAAQHNYSGRD